MAWVTPTDVNAGDAILASKWNQDVVENTKRLPRGVIDRKQATANQSGITSITDITGLSITFTAESDRYYRTTLYIAYYQQETSQNYPVIWITDGSNATKQAYTHLFPASAGGPAHVVLLETGLSGSITRKARASTPGGGLTLTASASQPMQFFIEDMGAA